MNTKRKSTAARTPASALRMTDSRGTQRVYVDLPADLVRRFNVLAATRGMPKRGLLAQIVEDAVKAAKL